MRGGREGAHVLRYAHFVSTLARAAQVDHGLFAWVVLKVLHHIIVVAALFFYATPGNVGRGCLTLHRTMHPNHYSMREISKSAKQKFVPYTTNLHAQYRIAWAMRLPRARH
jgi:hypothetical protein